MNDTFNLLLAESERLRGETNNARTQTHPELIEMAMGERKRFRVRLEQLKHELSSQVAELQGMKRALDIADGFTACDIADLDAARWSLIRGRKDDSTHSGG
jgi:hypothetical protein